jgi:hypothetical protein
MLLSLLFTASTAQAPVMLRFAPPLGASVRYQLVNSLDQNVPGRGTSKVVSTVPMTLKFVSRSGTRTTLESTNGQMKVDVSGQSGPGRGKEQLEAAGSGTKFKIVMEATGALVSSQRIGKAGNPGQAGAQGFAASTQALAFPNRAVRVGETWKSTFDVAKVMAAAGTTMPGMTISGKMPITTKLVAVKKLNGKTLANLRFSMAGTMNIAMQGQKIATQMNNKGESWVEVGTGVLQELRVTGTSTTSFGGASMVQKVATTMKRI